MGAWAEWPNLRRVDEATKHQLLDLIDPVVADGWEHRRACNYRARRSRGRVCAGDVDSQSGPRRPRGSQPGPDTRAEPESEDGNDGREHDHGTHQTPPFLLAFNHAGTAHDAPQTHIAGLRGRRSIASASRSDGKGQLQQRLVGLVSDRSMRSLLACDKTRKRPRSPRDIKCRSASCSGVRSRRLVTLEHVIDITLARSSLRLGRSACHPSGSAAVLVVSRARD